MVSKAGAISGSSPLTQGARFGRLRGRFRCGIIPAYAGSTGTMAGHWPLGRDHPRLRGEHRAASCSACTTMGSSPLTRGAPSPSRGSPLVGGIIPAYAGSTRSAFAEPCRAGDHPRLRWEHSEKLFLPDCKSRSSPLTRGARPRRRYIMPAIRIIPAYAGSTRRCAPRCATRRDHPRLRGEHLVTALLAVVCAGSSPLTRGAHESSFNIDVALRIIPAYAGSTQGSH